MTFGTGLRQKKGPVSVLLAYLQQTITQKQWFLDIINSYYLNPWDFRGCTLPKVDGPQGIQHSKMGWE